MEWDDEVAIVAIVANHNPGIPTRAPQNAGRGESCSVGVGFLEMVASPEIVPYANGLTLHGNEDRRIPQICHESCQAQPSALKGLD